MACLGPEATDRAANMARTDNTDFHLGTRGCLTRCGHRLEHPLEDERSCSAQQRAATAINSDMLEHQHTNCELQEILSRLSGLELFTSSRAVIITRKVS
jgi:hypothetical protein